MMRKTQQTLTATTPVLRQNGVRDHKEESSVGESNWSVWRKKTVARIVANPYAPWLTHGSLAILFVTEFSLILAAPFVVMLIPCIAIHHRIGILLHEYMHGIPFRRYRSNLWLLTVANSLLLTFGFQEVFRGTHLAHHRWLNTDRDPGYWRPPSGGPNSVCLRPFWIVYRAFAGDHGVSLYVRHLLSLRGGRHPYIKPGRIAAEAVLSLFFLLFWIAIGESRVPLALLTLHLCIWPPAAFRGTLEHSSTPDDSSFANEYRVRIPLFNMNRHIHHHVDPICPWYKLEFKTPNPRPPHVYWTHWYHVFLKRDYVFMQPMPDARSKRQSRL